MSAIFPLLANLSVLCLLIYVVHKLLGFKQTLSSILFIIFMALMALMFIAISVNTVIKGL